MAQRKPRKSYWSWEKSEGKQICSFGKIEKFYVKKVELYNVFDVETNISSFDN